MKIRNVSGKVKNIKIDGEWQSIKPFEVADLPEAVLNNEEGWKASVSEEDDKKDPEGKYSKTDLIDMKKKDQVKILKDFGVTHEILKKLKNEVERVAKILSLQK